MYNQIQYGKNYATINGKTREVLPVAITFTILNLIVRL